MKIGLTGGIASGKSTAATMFADLGIAVIDSDVIAHELVEPGQPALRAIIDEFGKDTLDNTGALDRTRMRKRVFANPAERKKLEAILHPRIAEALQAQAMAAHGPYRILVIPLLLETGMQGLVDRVLLVDCPTQLQLERLLSRDHGSESTARQILAAQLDRRDRLTGADDILVNQAGLDQLQAGVACLHKTYSALAA